jgi:acid phosphatase family membrane protein YuiD
MHWLSDLIRNPFLITALSSWLIAQVAKAILNFAITKKFSIERLFGDGGMPSGHSATVASLATISGLMYGFDSYQFAVATVLAVIICHDAMGIRLEAGKQAGAINEILRSFQGKTWDQLPEASFKELLGHTPIQVAAGILLGILNAIYMFDYVF